MQTQQIRAHYRQLRQALSPEQQQFNAIEVSQRINRLLGFNGKSKIAAYLATQAELSLNPWIASSTSHQIFLPMLYEPIEPRLRFARFDDNTCWKSNRFNIIEPDTHWGNTLHARQLDYVLLPLVAFDRQGHRMGMGGGFYDRSLAFRAARKRWTKPCLIGIAHSCQEHPGLDHQPWDINLDWIVTEREIIKASG